MQKREAKILTRTGIMFDVLNPKSEEVNIDDIVFALSNNCRFNGHVPFYSVAEHSVKLLLLMPTRFARYVLLHDAAETYIPDICSPLKVYMKESWPEIKTIETNLDKAIFKKFGLSHSLYRNIVKPLIKVAETKLLGVEQEMLQGLDYPESGLDHVKNTAWCFPPDKAYDLFMTYFDHHFKGIPFKK